MKAEAGTAAVWKRPCIPCQGVQLFLSWKRGSLKSCNLESGVMSFGVCFCFFLSNSNSIEGGGLQRHRATS